MPSADSDRPAPVPERDPDAPSPDLLVAAYVQGAFPMVDPETGDLEWYSPDPRGVFPLEEFHVPRNVGRLVRQAPFTIRSDTAFDRVMRACAAPRGQEDGSWIDERLVRAYAALHARGAAHSVEAWRDGELVGGLYGVHIGAAFFGESMFTASGASGASKVCLVHLVEHLRERGFELLDTQFWNHHLAQFGCVEIRRATYLRKLESAVRQGVAWSWA